MFKINRHLNNRKPPISEIKEIDFNGLKWIDIIKPTVTDIEMLRRDFDFHELPLEDCMTEHQRAKVDDYGEYCFIVLHLPRYKKALISLDSEEVDIFISKDYIITLHEGELKPLFSLANQCNTSEEARVEYMSDGSAILLYEIIKSMFDYCFPMLDKIGINLNEIDHTIFRDNSKTMLENISRLKMQIINYRRVIKPLRPVILTLEKAIKKYIPKDMEIYFDDLGDKTEKIWDVLENYKEVIESVDTTFGALTNQKSNNLMRIFTIVQVTILPMVLVGGLFSMNVEGIPLHFYPNAFWVVFGMILIPTALIVIFMLANRKKWF